METLLALNSNKLLWGVTMIMMNLGSKHVSGDLGKVHEKILTHELTKKVVVFCMFFVATRDILVSLLLCVLYIFVVDGLFHEKRRFKVIGDVIDDINETEYKKALELVQRYQARPLATTDAASASSPYETYLQQLGSLQD